MTTYSPSQILYYSIPDSNERKNFVVLLKKLLNDQIDFNAHLFIGIGANGKTTIIRLLNKIFTNKIITLSSYSLNKNNTEYKINFIDKIVVINDVDEFNINIINNILENNTIIITSNNLTSYELNNNMIVYQFQNNFVKFPVMYNEYESINNIHFDDDYVTEFKNYIMNY
jgi:hypothetical protein